jgi:hypothetical protein
MNQERRKLISAQISALRDVEYALIDVAEAEQKAFNNLPEGLQNSERGETMQEAINHLEAAVESIRSACDCLFTLKSI